MANKRLPKYSGDDDTEGHGGRQLPKATGDDDTEGHRKIPKASGDDESTEGHSMLSNPTIARELASAREQDIRRHLRDRSALIGQGERPKNRKG